MVNLFVLSITSPVRLYNKKYALVNLEYGDQIEKDILNHRTGIKYTTNQHLSILNKHKKKGTILLFLLIEPRDPRIGILDTNGTMAARISRNIWNILFLSRRAIFKWCVDRFQVVFDRLRINQYSIDWSEVIHEEDLSNTLRFFLSKSLRFFLSKSLLFVQSLCFFLSKLLSFFFVSFGNIPIHRSDIYIYELKGPNDQLYNQLLRINRYSNCSFEKIEAFLLDDHDTFQKSKFLINERTISLFCSIK
uniref:Ycf2 N-terminal domain-containing protein n=1 Tax=Actinidia deliciosa TaxID=3627 RepID=A0A7R7II85_ACTDE|nr:conserved hypothetical protein ycf2 [Actinidia deliciosa]